jgi:hypothetical protein
MFGAFIALLFIQVSSGKFKGEFQVGDKHFLLLCFNISVNLK